MLTTDLNCDMGEGMGVDEQILPYITSASIACGGHYGTAASIETAIRMCQRQGVAVGVHPSYPDLANFGRKNMDISIEDLLESLASQIGLFKTVCDTLGADMHHIKPHGALYNDMANDAELSTAIAQWLRQYHPHTIVYAMSGSLCSKVLQQHGLPVAQEVFADRAYTDTGHLVPRSQPGAIHDSESAVVAQVLNLVQRHQVCSINGQWLHLEADTVCLHSDTPGAVALAKQVFFHLQTNGISPQPFLA